MTASTRTLTESCRVERELAKWGSACSSEAGASGCRSKLLLDDVLCVEVEVDMLGETELATRCRPRDKKARIR